MKICAMSDLHGQLPKVDQLCDIVLICGDISPLDVQSNHHKCRRWLRNVFIPWCEELPCEKVFLIGGNHDSVLAGKPLSQIKAMFPIKVEYLCNTSYEYIDNEGNAYLIYGTPACHQFGNWSFMFSDEKLTEIYSQIPENVNILMSHDAPYGCTDIILQETPWNNYEHIGNKPLREIILKKKPTYNFHGHLHTSSHEFEQLDETKVVNVSILDERYEMVYKPLYLDINPNNKNITKL